MAKTSRVTRMLALVAILALLTTSFNLTTGRAATKLKVVATHSILGDFVKNVGGDLIDITTLVPPGGDTHTFQPNPSDSVALTDANLLFENGLGYETWLNKFYAASGSKATRVSVTDAITPLAVGATERLLVADFETNPVILVDIGTGKATASYDSKAPAYVYASPSGRYGMVIQTNANLITAVDSGILIEDHGDHLHTYKNPAKLTSFTMDGATPIHYVAHDGQIAIFNDGNGQATILTERNILSKDAPVITLKSARGHHGVAVPMGNKVLLSLPNTDPNDALPIGVEVRDLSGNVLDTFALCPGLHGEATSGVYVVFGCADGVMVVEKSGDSFKAKKIVTPAGTPGDVRVGTVIAHKAQPYLIGNFGAQGLVRIDPAEGKLTPITLPMRYSGFTLDKETGKTLYTVTTDGKLHAIDPLTGKILTSIDAVTPFVFKNKVPRPGLTATQQSLYITDPATGEVVEVNVKDMKVTRKFDVGGKPVRLAAIGILDLKRDALEQFDPHVWQDVSHSRAMVTAIRDALIKADPTNAASYRTNTAAYLKQLAELDSYIVAQTKLIPEARRQLVTPHNTFAYFAEKYGFKVIGTALGSVTTDTANPSPTEIAELVEEIKAAGIPAIFPENIANNKTLEQIAKESGVKLAPPLFTDALGDAGSKGDTYLNMMRYNITTMVEALK
jgi:ABC-type Zn uptake system ZnuABC Zn-binding protein ZnuA